MIIARTFPRTGLWWEPGLLLQNKSAWRLGKCWGQGSHNKIIQYVTWLSEGSIIAVSTARTVNTQPCMSLWNVNIQRTCKMLIVESLCDVFATGEPTRASGAHMCSADWRNHGVLADTGPWAIGDGYPVQNIYIYIYTMKWSYITCSNTKLSISITWPWETQGGKKTLTRDLIHGWFRWVNTSSRNWLEFAVSCKPHGWYNLFKHDKLKMKLH